MKSGRVLLQMQKSICKAEKIGLPVSVVEFLIAPITYVPYIVLYINGRLSNNIVNQWMTEFLNMFLNNIKA